MKGRQRIGKAFVHFTLSTAFGRKVRESFDGSEWFQALLRWSGGSQQQMGDKTMQEITDLGPGSVVAKETRAVNSRFFTSTRTSRWFGILLAVSTIFGFSPYQGILLGLIVVSAVSNQILTFNGLIALLESKRFSKTAAFIGAGIIGALFAFRPDMIIYGALIGGFTQGLSLWIYRRGRDFVRFPLQLVVTVMGPRMFQSPKFMVSGAAADAFKGTDISKKLKDMKSFKLAWVFYGIPFGILFMYAVMFNATVVNTFLLFPFLMIVVGTLVGVFSHNSPEGRHTAWSFAGTLSGWGAGIGILWRIKILSATVLGPINLMSYMPVIVTVSGLLLLLLRGLKNYMPQSVTRFKKKIEEAAKEKTASRSVRLLDKVINFKLERLDKGKELSSPWIRIISQFNRSLALSIFTLMWFFFAPGFAAINFEGLSQNIITIFTTDFVAVAAAGLVFVFAYYGLGRLMEWWDYTRKFKNEVEELNKKYLKNRKMYTPYEWSLIKNLLDHVTSLIAEVSHGGVEKVIAELKEHVNNPGTHRPDSEEAAEAYYDRIRPWATVLQGGPTVKTLGGIHPVGV
ncbi:MAG: hypothetical protein KAR32_00970, partial [Candidatus Omnitrophica bacterium]|nr:hypothetical protein [Candidatus Omnitrophota bacterium]